MDRGRVTKRPHGGSSSRRHPHRDAVIAHALNPPNTHPPEALLGDPASSSAASGTFERHGTAATNSVPKSTKPRGREQGKYACLLCRTVVTTSVRAKSHHELFHGLKQEDDKVPCPYCSTSTRTSSWVSPNPITRHINNQCPLPNGITGPPAEGWTFDEKLGRAIRTQANPDETYYLSAQLVQQNSSFSDLGCPPIPPLPDQTVPMTIDAHSSSHATAFIRPRPSIVQSDAPLPNDPLAWTHSIPAAFDPNLHTRVPPSTSHGSTFEDNNFLRPSVLASDTDYFPSFDEFSGSPLVYPAPGPSAQNFSTTSNPQPPHQYPPNHYSLSKPIALTQRQAVRYPDLLD